MLMIWFNKPHDVNTFTPAWAFLVCSSLRRCGTFLTISSLLIDLPYGEVASPLLFGQCLNQM
jgi:hypothetical protein